MFRVRSYRRRSAAATGILAAGLALGSLFAGAGSARAADLPVTWNGLLGYGGNFTNAAKSPPGANDWSCRPSAGRLPVVLVHGTWGNQNDSWQGMAPFLKNAGYCVFSLNYGGNPNDVFWGYRSVAANAGELSAFVDKVLAATGSTQVDLVGHSQGGMMPRYYIKFLGGMSKVNQLVALAPSNNGTTLSGLAGLGKFFGITTPLSTVQPAAIDQTIDSPFMKKLNSCPGTSTAYDVCIGDTVRYTVLETNGDQVVTPYTRAFLTVQPGSTTSVTNTEVNKVCSLEKTEHLGIVYSRNVGQLVLKALDPTVTKNVCVLSLPVVGG